MAINYITLTQLEKAVKGLVNKINGESLAINANMGDPANLNTTVKTNLVAAINEISGASSIVSVNGDTGAIIVDKLKTTVGDNNTEYNLIGTATTNTNTSAVPVYQPGLLNFSKYADNFARLTIGSNSTPGEVRIYTSANSASGYTDLKSAASSTNTRTITFPDATGTVALTSDIPSVSSWALASSKPSYTFSELTTTPTTLQGYGITDAYTKTEVDGLVSGVLHYKGTKATVSALPSSGNTTGDVWHVTADSGEYAWDGSTWQELGSTVDLSGYVPTSTTVNGKALTGNISLTASDVGALSTSTTYVSSFNGNTGAITYTAPVTSVNGQTGAVSLTIPDAISINKGYSGNGYIPIFSSTTGTCSSIPLVNTLWFNEEDSHTSQILYIGKSSNDEGYKGKIKLSNSGAVSGDYTTITPSGSSAVTLTLPSSTGTIALTSQIPSVPSWALASSKPSYTASEVGALASNTTYVSTFNGQSGAITYTAPVTSVNGSTGAVTTPNTTYTLSMSGNRITLTPSSGTATYVDLPVFNGSVT